MREKKIQRIIVFSHRIDEYPLENKSSKRMNMVKRIHIRKFQNQHCVEGRGKGGSDFGYACACATLAFSGKNVGFLCSDFTLVLTWSGTPGRAWMTLPREAWTESAAFSGSDKEKRRGE
jgi:hypothetical protein